MRRKRAERTRKARKEKFKEFLQWFGKAIGAALVAEFVRALIELLKGNH